MITSGEFTSADIHNGHKTKGSSINMFNHKMRRTFASTNKTLRLTRVAKQDINSQNAPSASHMPLLSRYFA